MDTILSLASVALGAFSRPPVQASGLVSSAYPRTSSIKEKNYRNMGGCNSSSSWVKATTKIIAAVAPIATNTVVQQLIPSQWTDQP